MTVANAVKKLSKYGEVQRNGQQFWALVNGHIVSFSTNYPNDPNATAFAFHERKATEQADSRSDYFPGMYWKTLTQALRIVNREVLQ